MKFCSILPLKNIDVMFGQSTVMLLAHLSQNHPEYSQMAADYSGYKIMDNSIVELGSAFSMEQLIKEADKCKADEIILPDVFDNGPETIESTKRSVQWLKDHNLIGKYKLMAVCHGKTLDEFKNTFYWLKLIPEIDVIGLPKILTYHGMDRLELARYVRLYSDKEIHLLGCWSGLDEYKGDTSEVRSTDTCLPALLSIYGLDTWYQRHRETIDLENDGINKKRYNKIMRELYAHCSI